MTNIIIRPMDCTDAPACVEIHMRAFQGFFLTFLGERFLHELYASIACDPTGIGFVAEEHGRIAGFVTGTDQPSGLYKRLLQKHWWNFGWASVGALAKRPAILPRLLRAFTLPNQKMEVCNCGTLMSIAVAPQAQGKKIGHRLVQAFLDESAYRGLEHVNLTTDRNGNESANYFYQRLGFKLLRHYVTPEGRQMNEYVYTLCPSMEREARPAFMPSRLPAD